MANADRRKGLHDLRGQGSAGGIRTHTNSRPVSSFRSSTVGAFQPEASNGSIALLTWTSGTRGCLASRRGSPAESPPTRDRGGVRRSLAAGPGTLTRPTRFADIGSDPRRAGPAQRVMSLLQRSMLPWLPHGLSNALCGAVGETNGTCECRKWINAGVLQPFCGDRRERQRHPDGGGGGIRTHGTVAGTPAFRAGQFSHSCTPPGFGGTRNATPLRVRSARGLWFGRWNFA